ncbi:Pre-mRNA-processing factor 6 [Perkinsus olseni]|uniref:Pre-mRNA-processing factor 6 n=4 Tax=Perkinsus olseni TaxID=32597 RepID=A0A7J6P4A9_PEROL|nr:Pre-mRNA-processing factor 6 [Perkinsus olseni]
MSLLPGQNPATRQGLTGAAGYPPPPGYTAGKGRGAGGFHVATRAEFAGLPQFPPIAPGTLGSHSRAFQKSKLARDSTAGAGQHSIHGRATGFTGGVSRDDASSSEITPIQDEENQDLGDSNFDEFAGYGGSLFQNTVYDEDDKEADEMYEQVDERLDEKRKKWREERMRDELLKMRDERPTISQQLLPFKRDLAKVSAEEWDAIPEAQEHLKTKKRRRETLAAASDSLLLSARSAGTFGTTDQSGGMSTPMTGMSTPMGFGTGGLSTPIGMGLSTPMGLGLSTPMGLGGGLSTPMGMSTPLGMGGLATPMGVGGLSTPMGMATPMGLSTPMGLATPATGGSGAAGSVNELGQAKAAVLAVQLDKLQDSITGQSVMDPKGYLTDLAAASRIGAAAGVGVDTDVNEVKKARLLFKSVTRSNPHHAAGWIAAARLEEMTGNLGQARELVAKGVQHCPKSEDLWLEAARLEKPENAKAVLAKAVRELPRSTKIWIDAANREVRREGLLTDAKILLRRATECCPKSEELWLALARLSEYHEAQKVLNQARKNVPTSALIWVTAARLQESSGNTSGIRKIIQRAMDSLRANGVKIDRRQWLQMAEDSENLGYTATTDALVDLTIDTNMDMTDSKACKREWVADADAALSRHRPHTARALYASATAKFPNKKGLWKRWAQLEARHGTAAQMDQVLAAAVEACPLAPQLWLISAKQKLLRGDVDGARAILQQAAQAVGSTSEDVHLAAAKIEVSNGDIQRARQLLAAARRQAEFSKEPCERIWMQSVQLERESGHTNQALALCKDAIVQYPHFAKLYMIGAHINMESGDVKEAERWASDGLEKCPRSVHLWIVAADVAAKMDKLPLARSILERGRLRNSTITEAAGAVGAAQATLGAAAKQHPHLDELWLKSIQLEETRAQARHMLNRALQQCPRSGLLWAKAVELEPKETRHAKTVDALKHCENDVHAVMAVAKFFWKDKGMIAKARKWYQNATSINSCNGDLWGEFFAFELAEGDGATQVKVARAYARLQHEQQINRGLKWNAIQKRVANWHLTATERMKAFLTEHYPEVLGKLEGNQEVLDALASGASRFKAATTGGSAGVETKAKADGGTADSETSEEPINDIRNTKME